MHAYLSPSSYHWTNYTDEKFEARYRAARAAQRGTELHALAHDLIDMNVKLPETQQTFNLYVNDAIGFKMTPEQVLFYSKNCFGTADTISFRQDFLRISDLKTGISPASHTQLEVYAAIFCLEYEKKPHLLNGIELRIYQDDGMFPLEPDPDKIVHIMNRIIAFDNMINEIKREDV